jgi:ABC-type bacteriocin/lantibiotic exporter with double-glycine peptidase domain
MSKQLALLKQWDEHWGDYPYAASTIAASGCGPTCFSMIAQYYGINITPPKAADFAILNGFYPTAAGTNWAFFAAAGKYFGIPIYQSWDPDEVLSALKQGIPCIGAHGPGEFTHGEHFIVYASITADHAVMVNDPKRDDTCKLYPWDFLVEDNARNGYVAFIPAPRILVKDS